MESQVMWPGRAFAQFETAFMYRTPAVLVALAATGALSPTATERAMAAAAEAEASRRRRRETFVKEEAIMNGVSLE
jgi:hypothetical protein